MTAIAGKGCFAQAWLSSTDTNGDNVARSNYKAVVSTLRQAHQMCTPSPNNAVSPNEERLLLSAINSRTPCCFLTVVGDNPGISVVHHLANYSTQFQAVGPLEGRVLGFLGDISSEGESDIPMLVKAPASNTSKVLFGVTEIRASAIADNKQMQDFYDEHDDLSMLVPPSYPAKYHARNTKPHAPKAPLAAVVELRRNIKKEEEMEEVIEILDDDDDSSDSDTDDDNDNHVVMQQHHQPPPPASGTFQMPSLMLIPTPWAPFYLRNSTNESLSPFAALKISESLIEAQLSDERHKCLARESLLTWLRAACMARSDDPNDCCTSCMSVAWEPILSTSQELQQWTREQMQVTFRKKIDGDTTGNNQEGNLALRRPYGVSNEGRSQHQQRQLAVNQQKQADSIHAAPPHPGDAIQTYYHAIEAEGPYAESTALGHHDRNSTSRDVSTQGASNAHPCRLANLHGISQNVKAATCTDNKHASLMNNIQSQRSQQFTIAIIDIPEHSMRECQNVEALKETILKMFPGCLKLEMYQNNRGWRFITHCCTVSATREVVLHLQQSQDFATYTIEILMVIPVSLEAIIGNLFRENGKRLKDIEIQFQSKILFRGPGFYHRQKENFTSFFPSRLLPKDESLRYCLAIGSNSRQVTLAAGAILDAVMGRPITGASDAQLGAMESASERTDKKRGRDDDYLIPNANT